MVYFGSCLYSVKDLISAKIRFRRFVLFLRMANAITKICPDNLWTHVNKEISTYCINSQAMLLFAFNIVD